MLNRPVPALPQRLARGFTLIEVMITVAIIGVIAAVAIPNYTQYVVRSKVTDATNGLVEARMKMEQYYQDNRRYSTTATGTTCPSTALPATGIFQIGCTASASGQAYTLTATSQTGKGLGSTAGHYVYTLNHSNTKGTTTYKNVTQSGKECWLLKGDEC